MNEAPPWLLTMRSMNGLSETPGSADTAKILAMADTIASIYPEMKSYCDQYNSDSIPWCGLTVADCMALAGIRPPFVKGKDTDCFLWARSWADDPGYTTLKVPRLGCVVILTRSGGGHVTLYESTRSDGMLMCRGGNQSDAINLAPFSKSNVLAYTWPSSSPVPVPEPPATRLPVLRKGDSGKDVLYMQTLIPKWLDGSFGETTQALLKEFQRSEGLQVDGVCGEQTWAALLDEKPPAPLPIPPDVKFTAKGKCSWFGGPDDKGVTPSEGLAFISKVEQKPVLFLPYQPAGTTGLARRLNPDINYIACRWDYKKTPRDMLLKEMALVRSKESGYEAHAYPADWGPNEKTGRIADLSPGLLAALDLETDDEVEVVFPVKP